jgi:hypothetical protein
MFARSNRLKRRVAELIVAAANRTGLDRVFGQKSKPAPESPKPATATDEAKTTN